MKYLGQPQSGSQAGTTASHNRAGQYYRNRRTPVTPTRTTRQATIRAQFGSASAAYQTLTPGEQAAWTAFAAAYPITDALGQSIVLTGQQYYVAINTQLQNAGQPLITAPPTNTTVNAVAPVTIFADAHGTFIVTYTPAVAGDFVLGAQSKLLSGGVSFNKTFTQVLIDSTQGGAMDFSASFAAQWGAMVAGRKVFARITPVNSSGMFTPGIIAQTVVVAASMTPTPAMAVSAGGTSAVTWAGGPADTLILYEAPAPGGPFSIILVTGSETSPYTAATPGTGNYYQCRISRAGSYGPLSNIVAGS